jgi:two-component sensor histidine kinase
MGNCVEAVAMAEQADSLQETIEIPVDKRIKFRNTYCAVLTSCDLHDLVPALAKEYLPEARLLKDKHIEANLVSRLINSYRGLQELDSALVYVHIMRDLLPVLNSTTFTSAYYSNASSVYFDLGEKDRAKELLRLGLDFGRRHSSQLSVYIKSVNLGFIEMGDSNFVRSISLLEEPLAFFEKSKRLDVLSNIYPALSKSYAGVGRYKEAYELNEKAYELRDSLNKVAFDNSLAETVALNEADRARRALEISTLELEAQRAINQSRIRLGAAILLGLLALFGISFLIIRARRQRKELQFSQQQAELRYSLLRAQMNPHFIFNSLNAIQSFFSGKRFERGNEYLGMFSQLVRRILEQTGQASISLHEELETLRIYLDLEQLRLGEMLSYTIHVSPQVELELLDVPPLVLQPFVENAIWHGIAPKNGAGRIDIYLNSDEDLESLHCIIEDDGRGMKHGSQPDNGHRSQGVDITRRRLGKGGRIDIQNREDKEDGVTGVRTELIIPLKD